MGRRKITVKTKHHAYTFEGDPQLHMLFTGTYFVSMPDPSSPSGRTVAWQQRIDDGYAEGVEITIHDGAEKEPPPQHGGGPTS
jgi:hypothetical protein